MTGTISIDLGPAVRSVEPLTSLFFGGLGFRILVNRLIDPLAAYEMRDGGVSMLILGRRRARQLRRHFARKEPKTRGRRMARAVLALEKR